MLFIIEEVKKSILGFLQGGVKVLENHSVNLFGINVN